jgi:hypothetical protein
MQYEEDDIETPIAAGYGEDPPDERDLTDLLRSPSMHSLMPIAIDTPVHEPIRIARKWRLMSLSVAAIVGAAAGAGATHAGRVVGPFHVQRLLGLVQTDAAPAAQPLMTEERAWAMTPFVVSIPDPTPVPQAAEPAPAQTLPTVSMPARPSPAVETPEPVEEPAAPFDRDAALAALASITPQLDDCTDPDVGPITTRVRVSFATSGHATSVNVVPLPAMTGSPMVSCIVGRLRQASVPAFDGDPVTVHTTIKVR